MSHDAALRSAVQFIPLIGASVSALVDSQASAVSRPARQLATASGQFDGARSAARNGPHRADGALNNRLIALGVTAWGLVA